MSRFTSDHTFQLSPDQQFLAGYSHPVLREWQVDRKLDKSRLVYPIFVTDEPDQKTEIKGLPEQYQLGLNQLRPLLKDLVEKGLKSIILFPVLVKNIHLKDLTASFADNEELNPVIPAIKLVRKEFPQLLVIVDLCLCGYTSHGHCGVLKDPCPSSLGHVIDADQSLERTCSIGLACAKAGAQVLAPSGMIDGRVGGLKSILRKNGLENSVSVMSYSSKFSSCFYGPFRNAANSAPTFGDRSTYQLPSNARQLAIRASLRDMSEGADFLMVKPGSMYMDIIRDLKEVTRLPLAVYHVSGEYSMLWYASQAGVLDLRRGVLEVLGGLIRAGGDIIITYYTPKLLDWLNE